MYFYNCIDFFNLIFLSTLIIVVSSNCEDHFHCFESGDKATDCSDRISWIRQGSVCNGKLDCPNGEDEAIFVCKQHVKYQRFGSYFTCATGAQIAKEFICNNETNCSDNSDELNCGYDPLDAEKLRGSCRESQIECLPGECKDLSTRCDGKHDCSNGLDESLKLCMTNCTHNQFQCGNGKCLPSQLLCNGFYDCPDGADEFPVVCNDDTTWDQMRAPRICEKPDGIEFANFVKFHQSKTNGNKYLLPNTPAKFECPITENLIGLQWNVCGPNGEWAHPLPKCIEAVNDGCPLPNPSRGRPKLYKCTHSNINSCNTSIELTPPINNMFVLLKCNEGYKIEPEVLQTRIVSCVNKKWIPFVYPKCRKV